MKSFLGGLFGPDSINKIIGFQSAAKKFTFACGTKTKLFFKEFQRLIDLTLGLLLQTSVLRIANIMIGS